MASQQQSKKLLGKKPLGAWENPDALEDLDKMASMLMASGKGPQDMIRCEMLYRQVAASRVHLLGISHPQTLDSLENLLRLLTYKAIHLSVSIPHEEINNLYNKITEEHIQIHGTDHPRTQSIREEHISWYRQTGKLREILMMRHALFAGMRAGDENSYDLSELNQTLEDVQEYMKIDGYANDAPLLLDLLKTVYTGFGLKLGPRDPRALEVQVTRAEIFNQSGQYDSALDTYQMAFDGFTQTLTGGPAIHRLGSTPTFKVLKAIAMLRPFTDAEKWKNTLRHIIEVYERYKPELHSDAIDMVITTGTLFDDTDGKGIKSEVEWYRACLESFEDVYKSPLSRSSTMPAETSFARIFEEASYPERIAVQESSSKAHPRVEKLRECIIRAVTSEVRPSYGSLGRTWLMLQRAVGFENAWPAFFDMEQDLSIVSPENASLALALIYEIIETDFSKGLIAWSPTNYIPAITLFTRLAGILERQSLFKPAVRFALSKAYTIVKGIGAPKEWARMAAFCGRMADIGAKSYRARKTMPASVESEPDFSTIEILEWYGAKLEFLESYGFNNADLTIRQPAKRERVRTLGSLAMFYIMIGEPQAGISCFVTSFETKNFATQIDKFALEVQDEKIAILQAEGEFNAAASWCDSAAEQGPPDHPISVRYVETAGDIYKSSFPNPNQALDRYYLAFTRHQGFHDDEETKTSVTLSRIAMKLAMMYSKMGKTSKVLQWCSIAVSTLESCQYRGSTHEETLELRFEVADILEKHEKCQEAISMRVMIAETLKIRLGQKSNRLMWEFLDEDGRLHGPCSGDMLSHMYFDGDVDGDTQVRPFEHGEFRKISTFEGESEASAAGKPPRRRRPKDLFTVGNHALWSAFKIWPDEEDIRDSERLEATEARIKKLKRMMVSSVMGQRVPTL